MNKNNCNSTVEMVQSQFDVLNSTEKTFRQIEAPRISISTSGCLKKTSNIKFATNQEQNEMKFSKYTNLWNNSFDTNRRTTL